MTQPVDPAQENSLPPIPLPPMPQQQQQPPAYGPGPIPQPGLSVPPGAFSGQPNPQQPYSGYPGQQPYQSVPQQYAIPSTPAGPGPLELDFWLPKTKLLALVALITPSAVALLHLIFSLFGYFTVVGLFNNFLSVIEALVVGLVMMFTVLGVGRILENKGKTD